MILNNNEVELLKKMIFKNDYLDSEEKELLNKLEKYSYKDIPFKNPEIHEILRMINNTSYKNIQDYLLKIDKEITFLILMKEQYRKERDKYKELYESNKFSWKNNR